ncbi:MAG: AAA family ATPase [Candidatus Hydrogenedentes bacterium]|nr:AAA family ATPase [Candidatus Hydrogenedentota bacterium]
MLENILVPRAYPLANTFNLDPNEVDPTIEVIGYDIPDPGTIDDPELQSHAAFLKAAVPEVDPGYQFRRELIRDVFYWWDFGEDVLLLYGPTGAGKTSLFEQWCARLGVPLFSFRGHRDFKEHEAFGHKDLVDGNTVFTPGPMTLAAQYGLPVICNEYDRIQPGKAIVFNDVFEGRPFPVPGNHSQIVVPTPGFRAVLTANTNLVEDPSGNYQTAAAADISLLERIYAVKVGYPDVETEVGMLKKALAGFDDALLAYWFDQEGIKVGTASGIKTGSAVSRDEFISGMVEVANKIRAQSKDGGSADDAALERTMSTRILRKWAVHTIRHAKSPEKYGKSALHLALKKYLSGLATESTTIALHQAVETVFGISEDLK